MAMTDEAELIGALEGLGRPRPSADLMARILADAAAERALCDALGALEDPVPSDLLMTRTLRDARAVAPGWRIRDVAAWGALAAAAVTGLMIGVADPGGWIGEGLPVGADYVLADLTPGYDFETLSEE